MFVAFFYQFAPALFEMLAFLMSLLSYYVHVYMQLNN